MKITKASITPIDYYGLRIVEYTSDNKLLSSVAEITIDPGTKHPRAYSKRSDKYYYVVSGNLEFIVENDSYSLAPGDVCVILKGQRFLYRNTTEEPAKVVLIHTPQFDLQSEVLEE
ncbi:MAG: cupin domain-containing protein [Desulfomonile tiedjei]|uniref:Cupin domain-containing protein n=1 Tax=Desulfomonile tiedjei TaxID=2358 RepID=A0A9D6UXA8_9BACT|nr:cupin domain-containing protein [Desulfomonile tiedjei]